MSMKFQRYLLGFVANNACNHALEFKSPCNYDKVSKLPTFSVIHPHPASVRPLAPSQTSFSRMFFSNSPRLSQVAPQPSTAWDQVLLQWWNSPSRSGRRWNGWVPDGLAENAWPSWQFWGVCPGMRQFCRKPKKLELSVSDILLFSIHDLGWWSWTSGVQNPGWWVMIGG